MLPVRIFSRRGRQTLSHSVRARSKLAVKTKTSSSSSPSSSPEADDAEVQVSLVEQQRRSLPRDLVTLMDSATVSAITHRLPVSKEKLRNRPPPTLWERILSYKSGYVEKTVLLNAEVADQIAATIALHSRGDSRTVFFDGEGGPCHLGARVRDMGLFRSVRVLEKDMELEQLHQYARDSLHLPEDVPILPMNLNQMVAEAMRTKNYESPLVDHLPDTGSVDESVPSYSLVSTVSHGFLKYLTSKLLYRDDPFSEFYSSRPEFFFILPARTYFHLCLSTHNPEPVRSRITEEEMRFRIKQMPKKNLYNLYYNVLFQSFFDFCLVDVIPRTAYYPWKPAPSLSQHQMNRNPLLRDNSDNLMMIYARPKKQEDMCVGNPKYLSHFLFNLFKNKNKNLCCLLEEWSGGWGLLVIDLGYTMFTQVKDLDADQMIELYQQLIRLPNFESSNFVMEAEFTFENQWEEHNSMDDMDEFRARFWRRVNSGSL